MAAQLCRDPLDGHGSEQSIGGGKRGVISPAPFSVSVSDWSKLPSYINSPAFLGRFNHTSPLQAAGEATPRSTICLLSPEVAGEARNSGLQMIHPPRVAEPHESSQRQVAAGVVGAERTAEVREAGETTRL